MDAWRSASLGGFPPPPPRPLPAWSQSVTSNEAYDWWRGVSCSHMACVCPGAKLDTCNCFVLCHLLCLPWQSYWRELLTWRCCHSGLSPAVFLLTSHTMKCCRIWGGVGGVGGFFLLLVYKDDDRYVWLPQNVLIFKLLLLVPFETRSFALSWREVTLFRTHHKLSDVK